MYSVQLNGLNCEHFKSVKAALECVPSWPVFISHVILYLMDYMRRVQRVFIPVADRSWISQTGRDGWKWNIYSASKWRSTMAYHSACGSECFSGYFQLTAHKGKNVRGSAFQGWVGMAMQIIGWCSLIFHHWAGAELYFSWLSVLLHPLVSKGSILHAFHLACMYACIEEHT